MPLASTHPISRRSALQAVGLAATSCALPARDPSPPARARPPNLVFILADDMGWADLSAYGRQDYQTQALDAFARQGVRLTQAYSASSICTPSRVAFHTGRYPQRLPVGLREPLAWAGQAPSGTLPGIPPEHSTLASLLKSASYRTALIGKWHAGYLPQHGPIKSGYETFFGIFSGGVDYFTHRDGTGEPDLWEDETPVEKTGYITDLITARAVDTIRAHAARREAFYLSVHYTAPHWPWEGPGDEAVSRNLTDLFHRDGGSSRVFAQMVSSLDAGVQRILAALDDAQVADDTLVVFTSDNGGERFSDMGPFTGRKGGVHEGSQRVPALVRYPRALPAGTVSAQVATTFDWTATLLAAAGVSPDPAYPLDGIDLLPLLATAGRAEPRPRQLFWRIRGQRAARDGDLKYLRLPAGEDESTASTATERLFDLSKDVGEQVDLSAERPEALAGLRSAWEAWNAQMLPELGSGRG
jgi:arylsulfatase A-like enzyme